MAKYKATVRMRKEWSDYWIRKPSKNNVLEAFADAVTRGKIGEVFDITIEKVEDNEKEDHGFRRKASSSSKKYGLHKNQK